MKIINKFLLKILLLSVATNQVAFCMNGLIDNNKRIRLLEEEQNENRKSNAIKRDKDLGLISILPNEILINICEWLKIEELNALSMTGKISNELINWYLRSPIKESNRTISLTIGNNTSNFIKNFNRSLNIMQEKMTKFIKGTNRTLIINFKPLFETHKELMFLKNIKNILCEKEQPESLTFKEENINKLELEDAVLNYSITNKDIIYSIISKNKSLIIFSTKALANFLMKNLYLCESVN